MWIRRTVIVAFWPLVVVIVRRTVRLRALFVRRTAAGQPPFSLPPPALHLNLTVTGVSHQPLALFGLLDERLARIDGFGVCLGRGVAVVVVVVVVVVEVVVGTAATWTVCEPLLARSSVSPLKLALT